MGLLARFGGCLDLSQRLQYSAPENQDLYDHDPVCPQGADRDFKHFSLTRTTSRRVRCRMDSLNASSSNHVAMLVISYQGRFRFFFLKSIRYRVIFKAFSRTVPTCAQPFFRSGITHVVCSRFQSVRRLKTMCAASLSARVEAIFFPKARLSLYRSRTLTLLSKISENSSCIAAITEPSRACITTH